MEKIIPILGSAMHEFSLCQALIKTLKQQKAFGTERHLVGIEVTIGPLSGVEPELMSHAFPLAIQDTEFEDVSLKIKHSAVQIECLDCQQTSPARVNDLRCPTCLSNNTLLIGGNECALTHLYYGEHPHV